MPKIRYRDLSVTDDGLRERLLSAVDQVLRSGLLLLGPEVNRFEEKFAQACGKRYCCGVGSGTDALYLALRCYDIGPGDEVITTPLSWIATLNAIYLCGATPIFVDIGEDLNIAPGAIEEAITPQTKAIIPVHFAGRLCDMPPILKIANQHQLVVIEDAAQAYGAKQNGSPAGSFGQIAAFSLNPMKVLPAFGEAGALLTNDSAIYEKAVALRYLGMVNKEICHYPALNAKIDSIQAAMLLVSMDYVDDIIRKRIALAQKYNGALADLMECPGIPEGPDDRHVFFDYVIMCDRRDALKAHLENSQIEVKIKHPFLMPHQPAYRDLYCRPLPNAEQSVGRMLSLPLHEKLTDPEVDRLLSTVRDFF